MSTATILELKPDQRAWLVISCEGGSWLADDGVGTYSLRTGEDLIRVLRVCQERPKPEPKAGAIAIEVQALVNGGWLLDFGDRRVVNEDDETAGRVLDDITRRQTGARSLFERFERLSYSGAPDDRFSIPFTDEKVTRGQLRTVAQGMRWLVKAAQAVSMSPDTKDPNG